MDAVDFIFSFALALLLFMVIDLVWLGYIAKDFYRKQLRQKLAKTPNWSIAILFYAIFIFGLQYFAIVPAISNEEFLQGVLDGFLYGIFTYSTYELTNQAILKSWPAKLVPVDIIWGGFLCASVTMLTYIIYFMF